VALGPLEFLIGLLALAVIAVPIGLLVLILREQRRRR